MHYYRTLLSRDAAVRHNAPARSVPGQTHGNAAHLIYRRQHMPYTGLGLSQEKPHLLIRQEVLAGPSFADCEDRVVLQISSSSKYSSSSSTVAC
jgi:hypothetical protein